MSVNLDPVIFFTKDISTEIFQFLDIKSLGCSCKVSKMWKQLAESNPVWRYVAQLYMGLQLPSNINFNIKEMMSKVLCLSNDQIISRLQSFLSRCSLDQNCRFRCILGHGAGYEHLTVEINRCGIDPEITFKEDYFAVKKLGNGDLQDGDQLPAIDSMEEKELKELYPQPSIHSTFFRKEPVYSLEGPYEKQYRVFAWRGTGGYSLKAMMPHPGSESSVTEMETKIDHMLASKSDQYMETK